MKRVVDETQVLDQNWRFLGQVESKVYDQRIRVQHNDENMAITLAIATERFASPLINQGLLSPIRYLTGNKGILGKAGEIADSVLHASAKAVFNRVLPKGMRASLESSGVKPRAA